MKNRKADPLEKARLARRALRGLLDTGELIVAPGTYDAFSAMLVERAGFPVAYVGSAATAASRLGLPDTGLLSLDEMAAQAGSVARAISIPLIADAEDGWHNAANIWRTVRRFEEEGVSAIHIEDHKFGKHTAARPTLHDAEVAAEKIRAAVEARSDPDFLIIARTDAPWATQDAGETVERLNAYAEAGADLVMVMGMTAREFGAIRAHVHAGCVLVDRPGDSRRDQMASGAAIVLYWGASMLAAMAGIEASLSRLASTLDADPMAPLRSHTPAFLALLDDPGFAERAKRHKLA